MAAARAATRPGQVIVLLQSSARTIGAPSCSRRAIATEGQAAAVGGGSSRLGHDTCQTVSCRYQRRRSQRESTKRPRREGHQLIRASLSPETDGDSSVAGMRLKITLDIGREKNTWMDPTWAASGKRMELTVALRLEEDGTLTPLGVAAFAQIKVTPGRWTIDNGRTLRMWIETSGLIRGDVSIPPGRLYMNVPIWGRVVSQTKGTLTVRQRRWVIREESRLVGRLRASSIPDDEGIELGPLKLKQGTLDGPMYFMTQDQDF